MLATTAMRFATTGLNQLTVSSTWEGIAGVFGLVLCGLAMCAALAMALEDTARGDSADGATQRQRALLARAGY